MLQCTRMRAHLACPSPQWREMRQEEGLHHDTDVIAHNIMAVQDDLCLPLPLHVLLLFVFKKAAPSRSIINPVTLQRLRSRKIDDRGSSVYNRVLFLWRSSKLSGLEFAIFQKFPWKCFPIVQKCIISLSLFISLCQGEK